jgi:DNA-binding NarL/FixJ family response regulator
VHVLNGIIWMAAAAVWELGATDYAARYRQLAQRFVAAGIPAGPLFSFDPMIARMAALLGNREEATQHFAQARLVLGNSGHRPIRALVDYDEALALLRADHARGGEDTMLRMQALLEAALEQFRALGMRGWVQQALSLHEQVAVRQSTLPVAPPPAPGSLTGREMEVLRLLAAGQTNKEIAATLRISVTTADRHVANIYAKIGARNRAEATAYAWQHGLTRRPVLQ